MSLRLVHTSPLCEQRPRAAQVAPLGQTARRVEQARGGVIGPRVPAHTRCSVQALEPKPPSPQSASALQGMLRGKYCSPTPMPADLLSLTKAVRASWASSHLLLPPGLTLLFMDPERSTSSSRSMGTCLAIWDSPA